MSPFTAAIADEREWLNVLETGTTNLGKRGVESRLSEIAITRAKIAELEMQAAEFAVSHLK